MLLRTILLRLYRLPSRSHHLTPADLGLEARDIQLPAVDGARLRGWYLPAGGPDDGGTHPVVVMHGWASAAEDLLPAAPAVVGVRIDAPVLVVHGLDDDTVPVEDAERLAEIGRSATLRLVPGADHRRLDGFLPVLPDVVAHLRDAVTPAPLDRDA